jgi:hypothetical protein
MRPMKRLITISILSVFALISCSNKKNKDIEYKPEKRNFNLDTSFISRVSISGFCPCKTTISDLSKLGVLKEIKTENMDFGPNCISSDARFDNQVGVILENVDGIIFQKEESTEYVSKIHLDYPFEGKLPTQQNISLVEMKFKDAKAMFPDFNFSTRGCSNYWKYSNDTISFYLEIDKTIKKYPLDENYYLDKPIAGIDIVLWCYKMYGPDYSDEIIYARPLYAPLKETHINSYVMKQKRGLSTKLEELTSFGKKTDFKIIRLGKWKEYSPDHRLIIDEDYDNKGNLIKKNL